MCDPLLPFKLNPALTVQITCIQNELFCASPDMQELMWICIVLHFWSLITWTNGHRMDTEDRSNEGTLDFAPTTGKFVIRPYYLLSSKVMPSLMTQIKKKSTDWCLKYTLTCSRKVLPNRTPLKIPAYINYITLLLLLYRHRSGGGFMQNRLPVNRQLNCPGPSKGKKPCLASKHKESLDAWLWHALIYV